MTALPQNQHGAPGNHHPECSGTWIADLSTQSPGQDKMADNARHSAAFTWSGLNAHTALSSPFCPQRHFPMNIAFYRQRHLPETH